MVDAIVLLQNQKAKVLIGDKQQIKMVSVTINSDPPSAIVDVVSTLINTYYVAKNGNDNNPGTEALPWLTIQKAADTLVAGDTVYVKQGTYNEKVIPLNSGTLGKYITYAPYPGHAVTITGSGIPLGLWDGLFEIRGRNYIKVSGFIIKNSKGVGIFVPKGPGWGHITNYGGSSYITIEKNYIYNTRNSGIMMQYGTNYIIDNNEIELGNNAPGERVEEIIAIQNNVDVFEIKNNHIHHSGAPTYGGEGIDVKWNVSNGKIYNNHVHDTKSVGIYVDAWSGCYYWGDNSCLGHGYARDIDVYNNKVHNTGGAGIAISAETGGNVDRINVYNNIVYDCEYSIMVPAYADGGSPVGFIYDVYVINNVFYSNKGGATIGDYKTNLNNIVLSNNIFSQNEWWQIRVKTASYIQNINVNHNLIDGFRNAAYEIKGTNYVESDPLFMNAAGADFHLKNMSPALNTGSPINAPINDYDGVFRPQGIAIDIGAYER